MLIFDNVQENIGHYVKNNHLFGITSSDMFETPDLFEKKNMVGVITHVHILAKTTAKLVEGYDGPLIEESSQVKSLWTQALMNTEIEGEDEVKPEKLNEEQQELLEWLNQKLSTAPHNGEFTPLESIGPSLKSGEIILQLLTILTHQQDVTSKAIMNPTTLWHYMQNSSIILEYISLRTFQKFEECTAQDIVLGDTNRICILLKFLRDKFDLDFLFISMMNEDLEDPNQAISLTDLQYENVEIIVSDSPVKKRHKKKRIKSNLTEETTEKPKRKSRRKKHIEEDGTSDTSDLTPGRRRKKKSPRSRLTRKRSHTTSDKPLPEDIILPTIEELKPKKERRRKKSSTKTPQLDPAARRSLLTQSLLKNSMDGKLLEIERVRRAQLGVRKRIIQELFDTERNYVSGLRNLYEHLVTPLKKQCILIEEDCVNVFSNLDVLLKHHESLLAGLKKTIDNYSNDDPIGPSFIDAVSINTFIIIMDSSNVFYSGKFL